MDTLPPLQRGKGIFVNLTLDGICRLHLSGGHAKISLRIYEEAARWGDKDRSAAPKKAGNAMEKRQKTSLTMCLVAIGIVYGDIGTSPLYVMKSILEGNGGITQINEPFIVGALSLIIWTITLLTTIKYVLIAMKADNHGEGGIFSLYSLVRSCKFLMLRRAVPLMSELSRTDEIILNCKYAVRRAAGSAIQWYGLDTSSVIVEQAPLVIPSAHENEKRIQRAK